MTLTIEIDSGTLARLQRQAHLRGTDLEHVARQIIQDNLPQDPQDLTMEEFDAIADELAALGTKLPVLPPDAYSRAAFYEGRY